MKDFEYWIKKYEVDLREMVMCWKAEGASDVIALAEITKTLWESEFTSRNKLILLGRMLKLVKEIYELKEESL